MDFARIPMSLPCSIPRQCSRRLRLAASIVLLSLALPALSAQGAADKEADLKQVRARIESIRQSLHAETGKRDKLASQLKDAELDIQSKRQSLAEIREERRTSERQLGELRAEQRKTEREIADERDQLAATVRLAYINGQAEQLKLLLNQEDPAEFGRMLAYYGYFGRARADRIASITDRLAHLALVAEKIATEAERLKSLESKQAERVGSLAEARAQRGRQLAAIQASLTSRGDQLKRLEREAASLEKLIAELRRAITDFPALAPQAFPKVQGKLPWPVSGKQLARFGSPRSGGPLKWEGILIAAKPGTPVRAPFHGRVVYADWLNGLGLLVVLDHGGGYMSLYGHNEELYRKVGDIVSPGDALGAVGERSSEAESALYLEIRRGKQPLDPRLWLRKP